MPKFIQTETLACLVTGTKVIEADDYELAREIFEEGGGKPVGEPEIGDTIESSYESTSIVEA